MCTIDRRCKISRFWRNHAFYSENTWSVYVVLVTDACSKPRKGFRLHIRVVFVCTFCRKTYGDNVMNETRVSRSRDVPLCSLDNWHQRFGETYCLHLPSSKWRKKLPVYPYSKPHGTTSDRL